MLTSCHGKAASPFNRSAKKSLSTFKLPPGFDIELIAAEPLISDPVDIAINGNGSMFVVEMHGYPLKTTPSDKVIKLTDTNGDGTMDKRTVFADELTLPTGVMTWKTGIIVTTAKKVYYMEDNTGDGKADIRKVLLTGFAQTNPQYLVNSPLYGLDNWIYLAHEGAEGSDSYPRKFGDRGSDIFYPDAPNGPRLPVNADGRIVRFRPDEHLLEETSSSSQFGQTFDTWGHHFLVYNTNHIYQEVIANRYLKRNPEQRVGNATESLSDHGEACEVFPITKNPRNQLLTDVGVVTSACGITDYLGGAFPDKFNNNTTFVCEPASNLVHVDHLKDRGATFTAHRTLDHKAFLASTDVRFRPVNLYTGPDGALYVVDYHREVIEHPEWMSDSAVQSGDLYNGHNKGRIYRISASGADSVSGTTPLNLNEASNKQLIDKLADPNIWWRRNAQRILVDRNSDQVVPSLVRMAKNMQSSLGRLHALWTLQGMDKLPPTLIEHALQDPVAGIRENAIKLAEHHLDAGPGLVSALIALKEDTNAKVRYQLLCTLGSVDTPKANKTRQALLFKDIEDKWVQIAALSASSSQSVAMLHRILTKFDPDISAYESLVQRLGATIGASQDAKTIHSFLEKAVNSHSNNKKGWQAPLLEGLADGLKSKGTITKLRMDQSLLLHTCFNHSDVQVRRGARHILQVIGFPEGKQIHIMQQAKRIAGNKKITQQKRTEAIRLLALQKPKHYVPFLEGLITPDASLTIQLAALRALSSIPDATVSLFVLQKWSKLTPRLKDAALNTFIAKPFSQKRIKLLLDAIETGKIKPTTVGWPRSVVLMRDIADSLKKRARALLAHKEEKRKSVIQRYSTTLRLKGVPARGKTVFLRNCITCHRFRGKMGVAFGPDLGTVLNWSPKSIMINILEPNRSISYGYNLWEVMLKNGTSRQGIISSKTSNAIILLNRGGRRTTISRKDIKSLETIGMSAMPVGFEKKINKQQMADLIAFIRQQ